MEINNSLIKSKCVDSVSATEKYKKITATFYLTILTFFTESWYKLTIASYKVRITIHEVRIARYKLAQKDWCSQNCEFISHNSDKKVIARKQVIIARYKLVIVREKSRVYITQLWGGKFSELWDKKSQWTFLFFNQWRKRASILLPNARIKYNITHQT